MTKNTTTISLFLKLWIFVNEQHDYVHHLISRNAATMFLMSLSIINVIICFYPTYKLIHVPSSPEMFYNITTHLSNTTIITDDGHRVDDDYVGYFGTTTVIYGASLSCLTISIPSLCDCVIDMIPQWMVLALFKDKRYSNVQSQAKSHGESSGIKMTIVERMMFIIGVMTLSTATYPSLQNFGIGRTMIWNGFANANTTLVLFPLLSFLVRYSDVFTPIRTILLSILIFLAPLLTTIGYGYYATNHPLAAYLAYISDISMMLATALCGVLMIISMVCTLLQKDTNIHDKKPDENKLADERFRVVVIGVHMLSTLITLLVQSLWFWYSGISSLTPQQVVIIMFSSIAAAALVYVMEFRVRKNEFMQALYTLLESKRTYVRYVSHELRTPLNAAFLGLKLVTDRLQDSTDEVEQEMYEVLNDVQLACNTSVEILNDLLCFDKIEGGILELHKQEVPVIRFLTETCRQFTGQARERGVKLLIDMTTNIHVTQRGQRSDDVSAPRGPAIDSLVHTDEELTLLTATDTCLLDKFKMEQVLRNLVSNALKFSPNGGTVTVNAYFVPSITGEEWSYEGGKSKDSTHLSSGGRHLIRRRQQQQKHHSPRHRNISSTHSILSNVNHVINHTMGPFPGRRISSQVNGIIGHLLGSERHSSKVLVGDHHGGDEHQAGISSLDVMEKGTGVGGVTGRENHKHQEETNEVVVDDVVAGGGGDGGGGGDLCDTGLGVHMTAPLNDMKAAAIPHTLHEEKPLGNYHGEDMVTINGRRGRLIITVTDTGPGISPENQKRLFKEIVQFNPEKLQAGGGSGFGLFISQGIIDLHDGCMGVYSQGEGHGATFSLTIPMIRQPFAHRPSVSAVSMMNDGLFKESHKSEDSHRIMFNDQRQLSNHSEQHGQHHEQQRYVSMYRLHDVPSLDVPSLDVPSLDMSGHDTNQLLLHQPMIGSAGISKDGSRNSPNGDVFNEEWGGVAVVEGTGTLRVLESNALSRSGNDSDRMNSARSHKNSARGGGGATEGKHSARNSARKSGRPSGEDNTRSSTSRSQRPGSFLIPFEETPSSAIAKPFVHSTITTTVTTDVVHIPTHSSMDEEKTLIHHEHHHVAGGDGGKSGDNNHDVLGMGPNLGQNRMPQGTVLPHKKGGVGYNDKVGLLHLLIVDDSTLSRKMLVKVLCAAGHTCDMAENGEKAVEKMKNNMMHVSNGATTDGMVVKLYDAVLTDYEMPVMNGPTSVREIRELGFKNKIFGLTGNGLAEQITFFLEAGCDKVFIKPFELELFNKAMEKEK